MLLFLCGLALKRKRFSWLTWLCDVPHRWKCPTSPPVAVKPCRSGWLITVSGWPHFSRTKINQPQIHAKKEQLFCSYFCANLSHIQGSSGKAAPCFRAETDCGELLLLPLTAWSPPWTQLWHIWSSGSSSCVRTGCRRWLPLSNAVLWSFSCVLWPHLHVAMGITRVRHGNCWIQLAKLHKFPYVHSKVQCWDLHSKDKSKSVPTFQGALLCAHRAPQAGLEKGSVVTQQSPKSSFAPADLLQLSKVNLGLSHCFPPSLLSSPPALILLLSDPCCWSTMSFM